MSEYVCHNMEFVQMLHLAMLDHKGSNSKGHFALTLFPFFSTSLMGSLVRITAGSVDPAPR